jgi:hypothetical protein
MGMGILVEMDVAVSPEEATLFGPRREVVHIEQSVTIPGSSPDLA